MYNLPFNIKVKPMKIILLLSLCSTLFLSWNIYNTISYTSEPIIDTKNIDIDNVENLIVESLDNGNYPETKNLLIISKRYNLIIDNEYYSNIVSSKEGILNNVYDTSSQFSEGFISGESKSGVALVGSITSDFLVIGDVRTLTNELEKDKKDRDMLNIGLSSAGIMLTVGTVATAGTASIGKFWVSFFKVAKQGKHLNKKLTKSLNTTFSNIFNYKNILSKNKVVNNKNLKLFRKDLTHLNEAKKNIGSIIGLMSSMKYIDNVKDFKKLKQLSVKYKKLTPAMLKVFGRSILIMTKVIKFTLMLIIKFILILISMILNIFTILKLVRTKPI